ncbi:MAG: hypothetical protein V1926_05520 [Candidatus Peregrinibacteria bacterium]
MPTKPDIAVSILSHAEQLPHILNSANSLVLTNDYCAQCFGLPEERTRISSPLRVDGAGASLHELSSGEEAVMLEDNASFCTLCCAVDDAGAASLIHVPLIVHGKHLEHAAHSLLMRYRKKVDVLLRPSRTLIVSGLNLGPAKIIFDTIEKIFPDATEILVQMTRNKLRRNILPVVKPGENYTGMLYIPRILARTARDTLLLLTHQADRKHMGRLL